MDYYAVCDKDGTRLIVKRSDQPQFNQAGKCYGSDETLSVDNDLEDLPDFPAPGEFRKVTRLSILPLEIEYEEPPFVARVWACCDKDDGQREIRQDTTDSRVELMEESGWWNGGTVVCGSVEVLNDIPNWPAPGERRELRCVPTLNIEWADEPKQEKPRFDDAVVESLLRNIEAEWPGWFGASGTKCWKNLARDLCTLRDQLK